MNVKSLKFTVLGIFLAFAIVGFFVSGENIAAQKKKSDILKKAFSYKTWKQPSKPVHNRPLEPLIQQVPNAISIADSSGFG